MSVRLCEATISAAAGLLEPSSAYALTNAQPRNVGVSNHSRSASNTARRRLSAPALDCALEPAHPFVVAATKPRGDELVFRAEVVVERHLRDARLGGDPVHADCPHAVAVEELRGRVEDTLS